MQDCVRLREEGQAYLLEKKSMKKFLNNIKRLQDNIPTLSQDQVFNISMENCQIPFRLSDILHHEFNFQDSVDQIMVPETISKKLFPMHVKFDKFPNEFPALHTLILSREEIENEYYILKSCRFIPLINLKFKGHGHPNVCLKYEFRINFQELFDQSILSNGERRSQTLKSLSHRERSLFQHSLRYEHMNLQQFDLSCNNPFSKSLNGDLILDSRRQYISETYYSHVDSLEIALNIPQALVFLFLSYASIYLFYDDELSITLPFPQKRIVSSNYSVPNNRGRYLFNGPVVPL